MLSVLDFIVIVFIGVLFLRMIYKTDAMKVVLGLGIIFVGFLTSDVIGLEKTAQLLGKVIDVLLIGLVIIFHQEIRMFLRKIGSLTKTKHKQMEMVSELEEAVYSMSEKKVGALILFDDENKMMQYTENLIEIDAKVSKELVETIFHENTSLHDGAMIIQGNRIAYAGAKLPYSGKMRPELEGLGTRHAVALEMAEVLDVVAVVVSEETGRVSIASAEDGLIKANNRKMFKAFFKRQEKKNAKK